MHKPLIGVTSRTAPVPPADLISVMVQQSYVNAILNAGGIPVLIPSAIGQQDWNDLADRLDGVLFTGGGDIETGLFHGEDHPAVYGIDANRDAIEIGLTRRVVERGTPFLGICRGLQVANVAMGGTLYTHIPDQLPGAVLHDNPGDGVNVRTALIHPVRIEEDSQIAKVLGQPVLHVNSLHHQGIRDLGNGFKACAYAPDGLVEAIEMPGHPFGIAVQWHPEWLTDQPSIRNLFKAFVDAAA